MASNQKIVTVIIPTFNEAENISSITDEILKNTPTAKIIIVDDDSKDDTEKIAKSLVLKDNRIKFISRKGKIRSFAQSYIDGFKAAIADNTAKKLVLGLSG